MSSHDSTGLTFALFHGSNLAVPFSDAADALGYMAEHADDLDDEATLLVFDGEGMCRTALVDARHLA